MRRHFAQWPAAGVLIACTLAILLLLPAMPAAAAWTPTRAVSGEDGVLRDFGQAVAPDGAGTVVWSGPSTADPGYQVFARTVDVDGDLAATSEISSADPGAVLTTASAPAIAYSGSVATVVWLESSYGSDVCLNDPYAEPPEPGEECVVTQSVKSRQIGSTGALGSVEILDQRQTAYPAEGPFGGSGAAFVSYGQPSLAAGPGGTTTVLWSESEFAAGCTSYGYDYGDEGEGCAADHAVRWVRLSAAGAPLGSPQPLYSRHTEGGGSANSQVRAELDAAADGTATVVLTARTDDGESGCWGGERTIQTRRIESNGALSALVEIDSGCGWTEPRLAVAGAGAAVVVWAWAESYAVNELRYTRIPAAGVPAAAEPLLPPDPEMAIDPPAVASAGTGATAVWGADGELQARSIPPAGEPGPVRTLAAAPSADRSLHGIDLALAPDGSGVVAWEVGKSSGSSFETGVKAIELAADGTPGTVRTLLSPNRWDHGPRVGVGSGGDFLAAWRLSTRPTDGIQVSRPGAGVPTANDSFAGAEEIAGSLPRFAAGSNEGASKEFEEPQHAGEPGGASLWYSWTPSSSGPVVISTCSSDGIDTLLGIYSGNAVDDLSEVHSSDDGGSECAATDSEARFNAIAGATYRIAVDGKGGTEGSFALKIAKRPNSLANDDFDEAREISSFLPASTSGSSFGATKEPPEPDHAGDPGGASLWYSWTPFADGPVSISTCFSGSFDPVIAIYTGSSLADLEPVGSDDDGSAHPECGADDGEVRFEAEAGTTYRIAVDGKGGGEGSFSLQLISFPDNDDFADARVMEPHLSTFASGDNRLATKEPGELEHAGEPGGASLWYSWTPSSSAEVAVSTCAFGQIDPVLAVYTGSSFASLTEVASDDDGSTRCAGKDAELRLSAVAGTTYAIAVDSKGSIRGPISLSIQPVPENDDFADATPISGLLPKELLDSNSYASKEPGEPPHDGDAGGASVWYSWTATVDSTVSVTACSFFISPVVGVYTGSAVNDLAAAGAGGPEDPSCSVNQSSVAFDAVAGTTYWIAVDGAGGGQGLFTLDLNAAAANDDFAEAEVLDASLPAFASGDNRLAGKEGPEPAHAGDPGGASVWYSWTPSASGPVAIYTCSFGVFDSLLGVYTGSSLEGLEAVASNDDGSSSFCEDSDSEVRFEAQAGTTYRIAVDGKGGDGGFFQLNLLGPPANDDIGNPLELSSGLPRFDWGSNKVASKQDGEQDHDGDGGGASVWYSWTPAGSGHVEVVACGIGALEPLLGVYTGSGLGDLTQVAPAASGSDPECGGGTRTVAFTASAATTYLIAVDGRDGREGDFELTLRGRPDNDDFADAAALPSWLPSWHYGDNLLATKEPQELDHAGEIGGASVWHSWTPAEDGVVKIGVCAFGGLDPLLAVYNGSALGDLSAVASTGADGDECSGGDGKLTLTVTAGTPYWIAVDGKGGSEGSFELTLRTAGPDNDDFADAIEIDQSRALVAGTTFGATVEFNEGNSSWPPAENSVWYRWTAPQDGPVHLHTCADSGTPMDISVFTGSSVGSLSNVSSLLAGTSVACQFGPSGGLPSGGTPVVSFEADAGTTYRVAVDSYFQISPVFERRPPGPFLLALNAPANDLRAMAERVPASGASLSRSNAGATQEVDEEEHAGAGGGASVWFRWFAPADGPVSIDTCGSVIDTLLSVRGPAEGGGGSGEEEYSDDLPTPDGGGSSAGEQYSDDPPPPVPGDGSVVVASSDDSESCGPGSTQSGVEFDAEEDSDYLIAVDGKDGEGGPIELTVDAPTPDTTPPQTSVSIAAFLNTLQLPFSAVLDEPESSLECSVNEGQFEPCGEMAVPGTVGGNLTLPGEGSHIVEIREVDAAGNVDPTPVRAAVTVDLIPPQTTITEGTEGLTRTLSQFAFEADEPIRRFECALDSGSFSFCEAPYAAPGSLPDGPHTFKVRAVDLAGNVDGSAATMSFTLDRTPPVTTIDFGPSGLVEAADVSFEFSADEDATFRCRLDGDPESECVSPAEHYELEDGEHSFSVRAIDTAGNEGATQLREFRVEARPPDTAIDEGPPAYTPDTSASFEFSADEEDTTFECALDGGEFESCESPHLLSGLPDGSHSFEVRAVDIAAKVDPSPAEQTWTVDTVPPATTIQSGPSGLTRHRGPFAFGSDEPGVSLECALDDSTAFGPCSATGYFIPAVPDGEHTLWVRAVDRAGNLDETPEERLIDLDTTPPGITIVKAPPAVATHDVTVEFVVDDGDASTTCSLDGQVFASCASPVEYGDLSEGQHTIRVRATDLAGNVGGAEVSFEVDETPPDTAIVSGPPDFTKSPTAVLGLSGSSDAVEFECSLDSEPFTPCASPVVYEGLEDGLHTVRAVAIDAVGNVDPSPAERQFTVDTAPPETTIVDGPVGPVHDPPVSFSYESSEELGGFECSMDSAPFSGCGSPAHDRRVGEHEFRVRAFDRAGNIDPTPAAYLFEVVNEQPTASFALDALSGSAAFHVNAAVGGSDPDGDPLNFELQWGDGSEDNGSLPHSSIAHVYEDPGIYLARFAVDDGYGTPVAVTRLVTVSPPEPLLAQAGDDLIAVAGEPVQLDGAGSRPPHGISAFEWDLGDGTVKSGAVVEHVYDAPGEYEAELTISRPGQAHADSATVTVLPPPPGDTAKVLVKGDGAPLAGADVLVILPGGERIQAVSGGAGVARLHGLPDGSYAVYADRPGYVPAVGELTVEAGEGEGLVEMRSGELATATVESHPLTLEEIEAAGIDPDDPENQHVYQFEVHIDLDLPWESSTLPLSFDGYVSEGGYHHPTCEQISPRVCRTRTSGGATVYTRVDWYGGVPLLSSLVIPFRATFLKEFYEVSMIVHNLAPPAFTLADGHARIEVPNGMSLAPTAVPQSAAVEVPDIAGGDSVSLDWILRGDVEGEYHVAAHYAASLEPFGRAIRLEGRTAEPIKVWGGSALRLEVDVDEEALDGYPYTVFVKLENVADVPVYNPAVELLKEGRVGYIEQPRQRRSFAVRELAPGDTHTAGPFILVPEPSGEVDLSDSFIRKTAGDVDLGGTIVTHERVPAFEQTPEVEVRGYGTKLVLDWDPVAGAAGYDVFSTPDRETDFPPNPLDVTELDPTKVAIDVADPDQRDHYGISSRLGEPTMVHPLTIGAGEMNTFWPKMGIDAGDRCSDRSTEVALDFEALDFELAGYEMKLDGVPFGAPRSLDGFSASAVEHVPFPAEDAANKDVDLEVVLTDSIGTKRTRTVDLACDYVALGDSYAAGEGVPEFEDGTHTSGNHCHRSGAAYSRLLKADAGLIGRVGDRLLFHACSGAVIADMSRTNPDHAGEIDQLDRIDESTHLVTLSIGGNDMQFSKIVTDCTLVGGLKALDPYCRNNHEKELQEGQELVERELPEVLREIRSKAPRARILVVEYPQIFPSFPVDPVDGFGAALSRSVPVAVAKLLASCNAILADNVFPWDVIWLSRAQRDANEMFRRTVEGAGARAEYVSMGGRFDGHDACQEVGGWIHAGNLGHGFLDPVYSFHPNEQGQRAMYEAIKEQLGGDAPGGSSFSIGAGEVIRRIVSVGGGPIARAVFSHWWPGSDVGLELKSPSGRTIGRETEADDVEHTKTGTFESYVVEEPEAGEWELAFTGLDVSPGGEPVEYEVTEVEEENLPPSAAFRQSTAAGATGLNVAFDASDSVDPDGTIDSFEWNFGDGAFGDGEQVNHVFATPGRYTVRLLVRDDDGAAALHAQEEIWVRDAPQAAADNYDTAVDHELDVPAAAGLLANDSYDDSGGPAVIEIVDPATHGELDVEQDGAFAYLPSPGYTGPDAFKYRLKDGGGLASTLATVTIDVSDPAGPGQGAGSQGAPGSSGQGQASSPPARSPGVALFARIGQAKGGAVLIRARCSGDTACRGAAKLTARMQAKRPAGRTPRRVARRKRNVVVGKGSFDIAAGKEQVLRIGLVGAGKQLLRKAGAGGLLVQLTGTGLEQRAVKLKPEANGKKGKRKGK